MLVPCPPGGEHTDYGAHAGVNLPEVLEVWPNARDFTWWENDQVTLQHFRDFNKSAWTQCLDPGAPTPTVLRPGY